MSDNRKVVSVRVSVSLEAAVARGGVRYGEHEVIPTEAEWQATALERRQRLAPYVAAGHWARLSAPSPDWPGVLEGLGWLDAEDERKAEEAALKAIEVERTRGLYREACGLDDDALFDGELLTRRDLGLPWLYGEDGARDALTERVRAAQRSIVEREDGRLAELPDGAAKLDRAERLVKLERELAPWAVAYLEAERVAAAARAVQAIRELWAARYEYVREHGSAEQAERASAEVLPESELAALLAERLPDLPEYEPLEESDLIAQCDERDCTAEWLSAFEVELTEYTAAQWAARKALASGVDGIDCRVSIVRHRLRCAESHHEVSNYALVAKAEALGVEYEREYAFPSE